MVRGDTHHGVDCICEYEKYGAWGHAPWRDSKNQKRIPITSFLTQKAKQNIRLFGLYSLFTAQSNIPSPFTVYHYRLLSLRN